MPRIPKMRAKSRAIHVELARLNKSQAELAEEAGISAPTVSAIANGAECKVPTANAIAAALGKPVGEIFDVIERPAAGEA